MTTPVHKQPRRRASLRIPFVPVVLLVFSLCAPAALTPSSAARIATARLKTSLILPKSPRSNAPRATATNPPLCPKASAGVAASSAESGGDYVVRMNVWFRVAHWGVMLSFPVLVYTGFALKYPEQSWARPLLQWEQHISFRGSLHRLAAMVLIAATLYHFIRLCINRRDRGFVRAMLPKWKDATDLFGVFLYNVGLRKDSPRFAKFNYAEKLEYWAFLWGTAIMSVSGFLLWFNNFALRHFPKWVSDAATAVHWYEALLATFSILLWHFYVVIFDPLVYPMDLAWLTGKVPAEHYRRSRPEYLRALQSAGPFRAADAQAADAETIVVRAAKHERAEHEDRKA